MQIKCWMESVHNFRTYFICCFCCCWTINISSNDWISNFYHYSITSVLKPRAYIQVTFKDANSTPKIYVHWNYKLCFIDVLCLEVEKSKIWVSRFLGPHLRFIKPLSSVWKAGERLQRSKVFLKKYCPCPEMLPSLRAVIHAHETNVIPSSGNMYLKTMNWSVKKKERHLK